MHFLFFDTETGGMDSNKNPILTAYFGIYDNDLNFIDDIYLQLKPDSMDGMFVHPEALSVNKINLEDHLKDPNTISYEAGKNKLISMLEKNKIPKKRKSFTPIGHNIDFDFDFIFKQLIDKETWETYIHYRKIDTFVVSSFLKDSGILPDDVGSLTSLVEYYEIPMKEAHNAKADIQMNVEVYRKMRGMMQTKKKDIAFSSGVSASLLEIIEE